MYAECKNFPTLMVKLYNSAYSLSLSQFTLPAPPSPQQQPNNKPGILHENNKKQSHQIYQQITTAQDAAKLLTLSLRPQVPEKQYTLRLHITTYVAR